MPHEKRKNGDGIRLHHELVMIGAETSGDQSRVRKLRERLVFEPDRKGLDRPLTQSTHQGNHRAGVDAPAQEGTDRHVADHPQADRLLKGPPQVLRKGLLWFPRLLSVIKIPVAMQAEMPLSQQEVVGWGKLPDVLKGRLRVRNVG